MDFSAERFWARKKVSLDKDRSDFPPTITTNQIRIRSLPIFALQSRLKVVSSAPSYLYSSDRIDCSGSFTMPKNVYVYADVGQYLHHLPRPTKGPRNLWACFLWLLRALVLQACPGECAEGLVFKRLSLFDGRPGEGNGEREAFHADALRGGAAVFLFDYKMGDHKGAKEEGADPSKKKEQQEGVDPSVWARLGTDYVLMEDPGALFLLLSKDFDLIVPLEVVKEKVILREATAKRVLVAGFQRAKKKYFEEKKPEHEVFSYVVIEGLPEGAFDKFLQDSEHPNHGPPKDVKIVLDWRINLGELTALKKTLKFVNKEGVRGRGGGSHRQDQSVKADSRGRRCKRGLQAEPRFEVHGEPPQQQFGGVDGGGRAGRARQHGDSFLKSRGWEANTVTVKYFHTVDRTVAVWPIALSQSKESLRLDPGQT
uniref:Uncharacterized protein n=1 Tax=Chromera velia CCMP2878 TaxID=1169474 RepID=A0A0G4IA81_9ALVE|eukprot:Cvel_2079.t1-p1 / transcript=Cvel_2079.t1 / gene=Cvel_2079 / organism=Chromera_velia_CCMP2878 / gene_product=hypothetical protein / transcript_product=hypothetical protein / location=Cvel_scaffold80:76021-84732(+) / protein_length=425 / sequence_SO=supercontig / SO=protein_coding / is_pseudo=false